MHFQVGGALLPFFFLLVLKPNVLPFLLRPTAPLGVLFRAESVGASLEAPVAPPAPTEKSTRNGGISFGVYAVVLGEVPGRLKLYSVIT